MKKNWRLFAIFLALTMIFSLVACSNADEKQPTGSEEPSDVEEQTDTLKVGVLMKTMSDTYSNKLGTAIETYMEDNYPDVTLLMLDGQADISKQISQAEDLIAQNVDVIVLNPQDADGSAQVLDLAQEADIPVIEVNTETVRTDYLSFIGSYDVEAGEIMGEYVAEAIGGKGQVAILEGLMGQSPQLLRKEGIDNVLKDYPEIEVVSTLSADWSRDKAMAVTEDLLGKYPDLVAIISENDDMAMGAVQAAEAQERDLVIVGTDGIPDAVQAIKDGRMSASVLQDAVGQAQMAMDVAVKVAKNEEVEPEYLVPFQLITADNVDDFIE